MSERQGVLSSIVAVLGMSLCLSAAAQQGAEGTGAPDAPRRDVYREALESLAEGRKSDALKKFQQAIDEEPMHAGALLEIALIQCSMGHTAEAERLFRDIEKRFAPPQAIRDLIGEERAGGCRGRPAQSNASVTIGRGTDANVNQGAKNPVYIVERDGGRVELPLLEEFLPKRDQYTVLSADYMRELSTDGVIGFVQFQNRRNDTLRQFDSASLYAGAETPFRFGRWTVRNTGMLGLISLGGNLYQRQAQLQTRIAPPLPLPASMQFNLLAGLTRNQHVRLANFDSHVFEVRGQLNYRKPHLFGSASVGYVDDRAIAERPGGNRHGVAVNLLGRRALWGSNIGELAYSYQTWNSELVYAPLVIEEVRRQATHVLRATLIYPLAKNHALQLEARLVRNDKDISIFRYDNRQLQLNYQWSIP